MGRALDRALLQHEAMPSVGGDPIVESGSNSDGEWTRWADGTQLCNFRDGFPGETQSNADRTWVYPKAFIEIPYTSCASVWDDTVSRIGVTGAPSITGLDYAIRNPDIGSYSGATANIKASGRWK